MRRRIDRDRLTPPFWAWGLVCMLIAGAAAAESAAKSPEIAAWEAFCERIKAAGTATLESYPQPAAIDRAEGLRYLAQQLRASVEMELTAQEGEVPLFRLGANTIDKWGFDSADAKTQRASVDGDGVYRVRGQLGSARLVAIQVMTPQPTFHAFASLSAEALGADASGRIDILVSTERPSDWQGTWLEMDPASDQILIREYFGDWQTEEPGRFTIERVDAVLLRPPLTTAAAAALLERTADRFATRPARWLPLVDGALRGPRNQLAVRPVGDQGLADNVYGGGWFDLAPDEALIIELEAPDALLWSIQLGNAWSESLDAFHHTAAWNGDQASVSADGRYRFVASAEDPGVPNWLDTLGHPQGRILFRYQRTKTRPQPNTQRVPLAQLHEYLPEDTLRVTPAQREAERARRRAHAARRWAP